MKTHVLFALAVAVLPLAAAPHPIGNIRKSVRSNSRSADFFGN
ncbi:MAG: hypothetical protein ABIS50_25405 [Luteolibacter sp.]